MNHNIFLILILIILFYFVNKNEGFVLFKKSPINNKTYKVQEYENPKKASILLSKLETNIDKLVKYLVNKYPNDERIIRLKNNLKYTDYEEAEHEENSSSYTINKGELISVCLRQKNSDKSFHDLNMLMFVIIHELAHVMSLSIGHNKEFMINFKFLLHEAVEIDIYKPTNYEIDNVNYCGVDVTHNPYYDN